MFRNFILVLWRYNLPSTACCGQIRWLYRWLELQVLLAEDWCKGCMRVKHISDVFVILHLYSNLGALTLDLGWLCFLINSFLYLSTVTHCVMIISTCSYERSSIIVFMQYLAKWPCDISCFMWHLRAPDLNVFVGSWLVKVHYYSNAFFDCVP